MKKSKKIILVIFMLVFCIPAFGVNNVTAWFPLPPPPPPPLPLHFIRTQLDLTFTFDEETLDLTWSADSGYSNGRSSKLWKCATMDDYGILVGSKSAWGDDDITYTITNPGAEFYYRIDVYDSNGVIYDWVKISPLDTDEDGINDYNEEFIYGTDPNDEDTDDDNILDGDEVYIYGTDPNDEDSDHDNVPDEEEIFIYETDPNNAYDNPKYALIIGISDYKEGLPYGTNPDDLQTGEFIDLTYGDETANYWFHYLVDVCHYNPDNIIVLGDDHPENYDQYNGKATEFNINYFLYDLAYQNAYKIAFITSGHGVSHDNGGGSSSIDAWDCCSGESGYDGTLFDTEVADLLSTSNAESIFIFLENCYSGGFIPELHAMPNSDQVYCTTTCSGSGYGWSYPNHGLGAWTVYFLKFGLIQEHGFNNPLTPMEDAFNYAAGWYPLYKSSPEDQPQKYDGNLSTTTTL